MNVTLQINEITYNADTSDYSLNGKIVDPSGIITTKTIADSLVGSKAFIIGDVEGVLTNGEFDIIELVTSGRSSFDIKIKNSDNIDSPFQIAPGTDAFICSVTSNGVYDIPDGVYLGISSALTTWARNKNIGQLVDALLDKIEGSDDKPYMQIVDLEDVVSDPEAADSSKKHAVKLDYEPSDDEVIVEINGIRYYENEKDGGGDFTVDRTNKLLYLDAYENEFTFEDLNDAANEIRVIYFKK